MEEDKHSAKHKELELLHPLSVQVLVLNDELVDTEEISEDKNDMNELRAELKAALSKVKDLEDKYSNLTSKLRDKVECPVCYEVPTTVPVPVCPNGHVVCAACVASQTHCPTCRARMFHGRSLLAATVIEHIEHKCPNMGCPTLSSLHQLEAHKTVCPHRLVECPAPVGECSQFVVFSELIHHVTEKCHGVERKDIWKFQNKCSWTLSASEGSFSLTLPFICHDQFFFLTSELTETGALAVCVQMLGTETECSSFGVDITLHRVEDPDMKGRHLHKFVGDVFSVDMDKKDQKELWINCWREIFEKNCFERKRDFTILHHCGFGKIQLRTLVLILKSSFRSKLALKLKLFYIQ
eukprot:GFUD01020628.1.p1 GENE.GFUD01020628.1~~GFUD01020628.1.p1  ORF type:complete len:352 (-),score=77.47 GFUD01020628.1:131-1186(-)